MISLAVALSDFFKVSYIFTCLAIDPTDEEIYRQANFHLQSNVKTCSYGSNQLNLIEDSKSVLMVNCKPDFSNKVDFYKEKHWLFMNEKDPISLKSAPLRLDSNVFTYEVEGSGGNDTFTLSEWYKVKSGPSMSNMIGTFSQSEGLVMDTRHKWERRRNLGGVTLLEGIVDFEVDWDPICIVSRDLKGVHTVSGAMPDMLTALQDKLNFTRQLRAAPDRDYGSLNPDGAWTGLVRMLKDGAIDVSAAGLTITAERSEVVDFTLGDIADSATVIMRNPLFYGGERKALTFLAYTKVFSIAAWLLIFAILTMFCLCYLALKPDRMPIEWCVFSLECLEGYALACLMLLQLTIEGSSLLWKSVAGKVLFCSLAYFGIVIYALYASDLTAFITAPAQINLVKSFEDIISRHMQVLAISGTYETALLDTAPDNTPMGQLEYLLMEADYDKSIQMIKSSDQQVLYTSALVVTHEPTLLALKEFRENIKSFLALGLQKDSEFKEIFDYYILEMIQSGIIHQINHKYLQPKPKDDSHRIFIEEVSPIGGPNVLFPISILVGGVILALIVSFSERVNVNMKSGVNTGSDG